jgi:hypothetical protein
VWWRSIGSNSWQGNLRIRQYGVRWDWLFFYTPREKGFYALAGVGFWFGKFEWEETSIW